MTLGQFTATWRFWLFWMLAFLAFPIGGVLAAAVAGPVTNAFRGLLGGALAGAVLGLAQWLVFRTNLALPISWVLLTSAGMAVGLGLSVAWLGSDMDGNSLLWRALITGLCIGAAQWLLLRWVLPGWLLWIAVNAVAWTAGWFITRSAGVDLSLKWAVFGATGALTFQLLTGLTLFAMGRLAQGGR